MNEYEILLKDLSYNSTFRFLEEGKDKNVLDEIATAKGIILPAKDLAIFECVYAFTDRINKNGCTLRRDEVEKALKTIVGKSIDLDHFRKVVVGHWIDAKLVEDKIIAYGAIFKGSFPEDYDVIKELFDRGNLGVSFEAWGDREPNPEGGYFLNEIQFAGGALLIKEQPAFPGAGVLELAKNRVLEFAKVMTAPNTFVHFKGEKEMESKKLENSKFSIWDSNALVNALSDVSCPCCEEVGRMHPTMVDFKNNKTKTECSSCGGESMVDLTPQATLTKKGSKVMKIATLDSVGSIEDPIKFIDEHDGSDAALIRLEMVLEKSLYKPLDLSYENRVQLTDEDFAVVANAGTTNKKIRIFPIHDLTRVEDTCNKLEQSNVTDFLTKLGINMDNVTRKISRRRINLAMKSLLEKYKKGTAQEVIQEVAKISIGRELTKEELEKAYSLVSLSGADAKGNPTAITTTTKDTPANDIKAHQSKAPANETSLQNASVTEDQLKEIIVQVTKQPDQASDELTLVKVQLSEASAKLEAALAELKIFREEKAAIEKAATDAKIKSRKDELGEFGKDLSDEDLLNETKYEIAQLKKENAELKAGKPTAPLTIAATATIPTDLAIGSESKPEVAKVKKSVDNIFFNLIDKDSNVTEK